MVGVLWRGGHGVAVGGKKSHRVGGGRQNGRCDCGRSDKRGRGQSGGGWINLCLEGFGSERAIQHIFALVVISLFGYGIFQNNYLLYEASKGVEDATCLGVFDAVVF